MPKLTHDGRRFRLEGHRGSASFADMLRWQFNGARARWPAQVENPVHPPPPQRVAGSDLVATWIGHSTVLIQTAGLNILTDPFLSERASPLSFAGPKRVRPAALLAHQLPPIDIVLVSHNHYDHMDLPALRQIAHHHQPSVVTPKGNACWIAGAGHARIDEVHWGETVAAEGLRIHLTPALHWSKRSFFDTNRALWGAFAIETPGGLIYFAADTGFGDGHTFSDIRRQFGSPRLSLLPIGAYEPRWFMSPQHMNPEEAVQAHKLLGSRTSLAIHHGTIQLTDEAIDAPVKALAESLDAHAIDARWFQVTDAGKPTVIP